ncbi:hypothetical protein DJ021_13560 [Phenylobacterium hankyongense]|uniref:TonB-dependent receptor n=1 Tax=Phenylobacterium hankyongense TaxID=1813876 RepID=A0A328B055_9CAUL|nr:hypothetical protein DJ021_13560 [Phenylobacterium hankyongense]
MRVQLTQKRKLCCSAAAFALITSVGLPAAAQEAADKPVTQVEEIVVTATKRAERLLDVPISISAYDEKSLDKSGVRDVNGLAAITPGLTFQSTGVTNNITIRGVAADALRGPPTTAIYIDDVPLLFNKGFGTTTVPTPKIFDLDRIEVLRGPQGTLFGGSAMGGAVRFITPQPSLTSSSGYARGEVADTSGGGLSYEAGAAVGGPIIQDKLGFRISADYRRDGGVVDNYSSIPGGVNQKNTDYSDTYAMRAALAYAPTDNVTITPSLYYQDVKTNNRSFINEAASNPHNHQYIATNLMLSPSRDKFFLPSLNMSVDLGAVKFTSITAYLSRDSNQTADYTTFVPSIVNGPQPTSAANMSQLQLNSTQRNFSQEFRLANTDPNARLKWTVGAFYRRSVVDGVQQIYSPNFGNYIQSSFGKTVEQKFGHGMANGVYSLFSQQGFVDKEIAAFVDAEFALTDQLSIAGGVRFSHLEQNFYYVGAGPLTGLASFQGSAKSSPVTPRISLNYKPSRDQLFYVSAAKGYRAGGANTPLSGFAQPGCQTALSGYGDTTTYAPDSLWSYEAGSKSSLFGGRVRVDASAFHIDWKNITNNVTVAACSGNFLANLGDASVNGFDLGVTANPVRNLTLSLATGYTSATYSKGAALGSNVFTRKGEQIADTPPWNVSVAAEYSFDLPHDASGYVRVEDRYRSMNDGSFPFLNPTDKLYNPALVVNPMVNTLNARFGVTRQGYDISVFADNILNDNSVLDIQRSPLIGFPYNGGHPVQPFTVGLTATKRW